MATNATVSSTFAVLHRQGLLSTAGATLIGTYLGVHVYLVVQSLLADQMPDGGRNC